MAERNGDTWAVYIRTAFGRHEVRNDVPDEALADALEDSCQKMYDLGAKHEAEMFERGIESLLAERRKAALNHADDTYLNR